MSDSQWIRLCRADEIQEDAGRSLRVDGRDIGVFNLGGTICALADRCPHGDALLSKGWVEDGIVECPLHGAQFDIRTGRVLCGPAKEDVATFELRIDNGEVFMNPEAAGAMAACARSEE